MMSLPEVVLSPVLEITVGDKTVRIMPGADWMELDLDAFMKRYAEPAIARLMAETRGE
jgi:hypothetical protein